MSWRSSEQKMKLIKALNSGKDIVFLDVETTGTSIKKDYVIQFSGIKFKKINNQLVPCEDYDYYIKPPVLITSKITEITGITNDFLEDKSSEEDVFPIIKKALENAVIVAYNAPFDVGMLRALYQRQNNELQCEIVLDVLEMARDLVSKKESGSHKLCDIAALYGVQDGIQFHNAYSDVVVMARLFNVFMMEYFENPKEKKTLNKAIVKSIMYWEGYKGNSRIFVNTDKGTVYYDIRKYEWGDKNLGMDSYDMEDIRRQAFAMANVSNEKEFAKYR